MYDRIDLTFASKEDSLTVRKFTAREGMSKLFEVDIEARSKDDDIDLATIVGKGAVMRVANELQLGPSARIWNGICAEMELVNVESAGLSTYRLKIVPALWRTTLRKNNRIFQHKTVVEIVLAILEEWQIKPELKLEPANYPTYEYKVQWNETDFSFISRLLEDAGIAYFFAYGDGKTPEEQTRLVLVDEPQGAPLRARGPLAFAADNASSRTEKDWVSHVRLTQQVAPGHYTLRDYDFRKKADFQLVKDARDGIPDGEDKYELYNYVQGSFLVEPGTAGDTPVADDKGIARVDEKFGKELATRALDAARRDALKLSCNTNSPDLWPGQIMAISDHPRKDLASDKTLLVIETRHEGGETETWKMSIDAVFTAKRYRPLRLTPKPRMVGPQNAVVVGPAGEEIHTDEFGRIRVQFHWDREGKFDDFSSCWIHVSQPWAGFGYGAINLPRVGHGVIVDFFDGDPDQPIVVGRVFNNTTRVPYKLPDNKTKSGWKSDSSPGSGGFNEISFEDAAGREEIHMQAQKDHSEIIKNNQTSTVLNNRTASITSNDATTIGKNQSLDVDVNRRITIGDSQVTNITKTRVSVIGENDFIEAGKIYRLNVGGGNGLLVHGDSRTIVLTTGQATIILGPNSISLNATGDMEISAGGKLKLSGASVEVDGGPNVFINTAGPKGPTVIPFDKAMTPSEPQKPGSGGKSSDAAPLMSGQGVVEKPLGFEDVAANPPLFPAEAPTKIALPAEVNKAFASEIRKVDNAIEAVKAAPKAFLTKENLKKAVDIVKAIKEAKATKGMSLLGIPEIKGAIGAIVTTPIAGTITGMDIADLLNQADAFGLIHLSDKAKAATGLMRAASPDTPNRVTKFLGEVVTKPILGNFSMADVAGLLKQGVDAGLVKVGAKELKAVGAVVGVTPPGTKNALVGVLGSALSSPVLGELSVADLGEAVTGLAGSKVLKLNEDQTKALKGIDLLSKAAKPEVPKVDAAKVTPPVEAKPASVAFVKTAATPSIIDGAKMDAHAAALERGGMAPHDAMLAALDEQGVTTYVGDENGMFTKVMA